MSPAAQYYPELIERWRRPCIDYNGSIIVDGADPVTVPNCGDLRELTAAIAALLAERDGALDAQENCADAFNAKQEALAEALSERDTAIARANALAKRCEVLEAGTQAPPIDTIKRTRGRPASISDMKAYKANKAREYRARDKQKGKMP